MEDQEQLNSFSLLLLCTAIIPLLTFRFAPFLACPSSQVFRYIYIFLRSAFPVHTFYILSYCLYNGVLYTLAPRYCSLTLDLQQPTFLTISRAGCEAKISRAVI